MPQRKMIVTAPGSLGDVNPMLAIARQLQTAGHDVLFLAAERYLPLATRAGLATRTLVTEQQFQRLASNPRLWHPRHGARLLFREAVEHFLEPHFEWLEQNCPPERTTLVSHVLDFSGRVFRDKYPATRFISVLPAPAMLRSSRTPPRLSSYFWERWIPGRLMPLLYRCADAWVDRIGAGPLNAFREKNGLPPVSRLLNRWWWSPDLVLGLFPDWFSIDSRDLPPQMRLIGFPLADSADIVAPAVMDELEGLLAQFEGVKPIVFAPGTAHEYAGAFLRSATTACQQLGLPGILLSTNASQIPEDLPPQVVAAKYLPFSKLLPQAGAIVHHGGIGTTSQALRAGTPQLILPMAFDQFDNAERVAKLACGDWLPMHRQSPPRLVNRLRTLPLKSIGTAQVAQRFCPPRSAAGEAVQYIERLLAN